MTELQQALPVSDHRLLPVKMKDDSVVRWRCLDCQVEHGCVSDYLSDICVTQL